MKRLPIILTLLTLFITTPAMAITTSEILQKHGKRAVREFILKKSPGTITAEVDGVLLIKYGRISMDYITVASIANDLKKMGLSANQFDNALKKYKHSLAVEKQKKKEQEEARQEYIKEHPKTVRASNSNYNNSGTATHRPTSKKRYRRNLNSNKSASTVQKEIKDFAYRKYPNDKKLQRYTYNKQVSAYNYLLRVKDIEIKQFAQKKYPDDYSMQKYVYDKQVSAKRYMKNIDDQGIYRFSQKKYPNDYSMQKYVYDKQLSAKKYMETIPHNKAWSVAKRKYPYDYSMQKYIYGKMAY